MVSLVDEHDPRWRQVPPRERLDRGHLNPRHSVGRGASEEHPGGNAEVCQPADGLMHQLAPMHHEQHHRIRLSPDHLGSDHSLAEGGRGDDQRTLIDVSAGNHIKLAGT
jgi:hypothetical protein